MTITWGPYENASGTGLRCGIQIESVTTPSNGSSTFVVTFSCWTQNSASYSDNQTFDINTSGGVSASLSDNSIAYFNGEGTTATKRGSNQTATYTYSTYGTSPGSIKINATIGGTFNGVTPSVSVSYTVPARPWANADATTAAAASRTSDTQAAVSWTNHDATSKAYNNIKLYRSTNGGSYALVSTLGVVSSTNDTTISANNKYLYRPNVLGKNGVEITGDVTDTAIWTTPGAPSGATATKQGNGDIKITWTNNVNYSEYGTRVEHSTNGGSSWSEIDSVAGGVATYTHVAPGTGTTHTYRVRSRSTTGSLNSAYSTSNTVTLLSTAGPPTGLSPSGLYFDAAGNIVLTWTHNPTDGTPQSKYQLQYAVDGGAYTTVGPTTSALSTYTLTGGTLTNGHTITWRVATAGENGTVGSYSSVATFYTQDRPTSTISVPSGGTYNLSQLTAEWTYFQAQSAPQSAWHAYLYKKNSAPDFSDATIVGEEAGSGTDDSVTFDTTLLDGVDYGVRVYVTSSNGLESVDAGTDLEEFTVSFLPPADVTVTAEYDANSGQMIVTLTGDADVGGVTEPISTVDVQRKIGFTGEWVTWAVGIVLSGDLTANLVDVAPNIHGDNYYRAIARSAVPSSAISDEAVVVTAEPRWGFLSGQQFGFANALRMRARLAGTSTTGRSRNVYAFAGREQPVELSGEDTSKQYSVAATLYGQSSAPQDLEDMGETTGIVLWRDYTGRRMYASISAVSVNYNTDSVLFPVNFILTRVDYNEDVT